MGTGFFSAPEHKSSGPETHPVDWDVSWGNWTVRVRAQYGYAAREKGAMLINQLYEPTIQLEHYGTKPVPYSLSGMDVEAQHSFRPNALGVTYIIDRVCDILAQDPKKLLLDSRRKGTARARKIAMYLAREKTDLSLSEIGEVFERDQSSVLKAHSDIVKALRKDTGLKEMIAAILEVFPG